MLKSDQTINWLDVSRFPQKPHSGDVYKPSTQSPTIAVICSLIAFKSWLSFSILSGGGGKKSSATAWKAKTWKRTRTCFNLPLTHLELSPACLQMPAEFSYVFWKRRGHLSIMNLNSGYYLTISIQIPVTQRHFLQQTSLLVIPLDVLWLQLLLDSLRTSARHFLRISS